MWGCLPEGPGLRRQVSVFLLFVGVWFVGWEHPGRGLCGPGCFRGRGGRSDFDLDLDTAGELELHQGVNGFGR